MAIAKRELSMIRALAFSLPFLLPTSIGMTQEARERFVCQFQQIGGRDALRLEFLYEPSRARAFMIGNAGLSDVLPTRGSSVTSFMEFLDSGAVQTTTIARDGQAVHSRHSWIIDRFVPSQFSGQCQRS